MGKETSKKEMDLDVFYDVIHDTFRSFHIYTCYKYLILENIFLELGSGALEEEGFVGIVIAASTVILLFAIILLAVIATRPKSNM